MVFKKKPTKEEIGKLKKNALNNIVDMSIEEIANEIGNNGRAFYPTFMQGGMKRDNFESMQLFALDFDNKDENITFDEILRIADSYGIPICFAYETFSSTKEKQRFRVVFQHEFPIDNVRIAEIMIGMLQKIFSYSDNACKDISRLFFGGKKLLYLKKDTHIHLVNNLLFPLYKALDTNNNFPRNIRSFAKVHKIMINEDKLLITSNQISIDFDGNQRLNNINILLERQNPSISVMSSGDINIYTTIDARHGLKWDSKKSGHKHRKLEIEIEKKKSCKLLNDFVKGKILDHNERFAILTNLSKIKNGSKYFMDILERFYPEDTMKKWDGYKYVVQYFPQSCSPEFCKYYYECHTGEYRNIIEILRNEHAVTYDDSLRFGTLEEAEKNLTNNLHLALQSKAKGIHIIKAQTSLGKTTAYIYYIEQHPEDKFIIAVPTNLLKDEVAKKLREKGVSTFVTPSVRDNYLIPEKIQNEIMELHELGIHDKTKSVIKDYYNEIENSCKMAVKQECIRILKDIEGYGNEQVVVTTHAYYLNMKPDFISKFSVIIDEDIFYLAITNSIKNVSIDMLHKLKNSLNGFYKNIADKIINAPDNQYCRIEERPNVIPLTSKELDSLDINGNVNDLKLARAFIKETSEDNGDCIISYFAPPRLPDAKTVILSATFNVEIYRRYFTREVIEYPEVLAPYYGKVKQYTYHSLGRNNLAKKENEINEFIKSKLGFVKESISFKNFDYYNSSNLHYGNAMGVNCLEGKDILIIGTPFKNEKCYKLLATVLGEKITSKDVSRMRNIYYKGYTFQIMTYKNDMLQKIQLYSIESELEQCVGRARLLRFDCTVYLLSSFPVEQAELITYDYLKGRKEAIETL